ncbi:hypothetical protein BKA69DRAFT_1102557 [Paraphysoderma sedebokerense]|nr:hypothetical protein BKA69DRAFT_1102557 [Paraphysoderma sedebokerense]
MYDSALEYTSSAPSEIEFPPSLNSISSSISVPSNSPTSEPTSPPELVASPTYVNTSSGGKMNVLLIQSAHGLFASSGGYKANFALLSGLHMQGHTVTQVGFCVKKDLPNIKSPVEFGKWEFECSDANFEVNQRALDGRMNEELQDAVPKTTNVREKETSQTLQNDIVSISGKPIARGCNNQGDIPVQSDSPKQVPVERQLSCTRRNVSVTIYKTVIDGVNTIAFDADEYFTVFNKEFMHDWYCQWVEDKISLPEFESLEQFFVSIVNDLNPSHLIFNESTSLKLSMKFNWMTRIFVVHSAEHLPFGPYAGYEIPNFCPGLHEIEEPRLQSIEAIFCVSRALQSYINTHSHVPLSPLHVPIHPLIYGKPPYPVYDNWNKNWIVGVNLGELKGWSVFKQIVKRLGKKMKDNGMKFVLVKSWNVTKKIEEEAKLLDNLMIVDSFLNPEHLYRQTKLLIMPSLWFEAFGLVALEPTLRGVPITTSNTGGLPESHLQLPYTLEVKPITGPDNDTIELLNQTNNPPPTTNMDSETNENYNILDFDEDQYEYTYTYEIPNQSPDTLNQWISSVEKLCTNREEYESFRTLGMQRARKYVERLDWEMYERILKDLSQKKNVNESHKGEIDSNKDRIRGIEE